MMATKKMTYDIASKIVSEEFLLAANSTNDTTRLKTFVVEAEEGLEAEQDAEDADAQLAAAKAIAKDLGAGYKEAKKAYRAKIVVSINRLRELGQI